MNHKIYNKIVAKRLHGDRQSFLQSNAIIHVVYTSPDLVKAGQVIMRAKKRNIALKGLSPA